MSTIVLRSVKGAPLTNTEVDANFSNLNTDKLELGGTYSSGTANGVGYLNASKVLTTGSALTFDGTTLVNTRNTTDGSAAALTLNNSGATASYATLNLNAGSVTYQQFADAAGNAIGTAGVMFRTTSNHPLVWGINNLEQMRLTSTGLGIGTSSPASQLDVSKTGDATISLTSAGVQRYQLIARSGGNFEVYDQSSAASRLTLTQSGNLGLGVTPSASWSGTYAKAFQLGNKGASISGFTSSLSALPYVNIGNNSYYASDANWKYYDGANGAALYQQSANSHRFLIAGTGTTDGTISFTQAMTLDASGNLIVGGTTALVTAANRGNVTVNGTTSSLVALGVNNTATASFYADATVVNLSARTNIPLLLSTNDTERARITSGGALLVGTTTTILASKFASVAGASQNGGAFQTSASANNYTAIAGARNGNNGNVAEWWYDLSTQVGTISVTSTATAYNTSSDYRLKNITGPITNSGAYIDSLNPVEGTWKADGSTFVGLIAHEVQEASRTNVTTGVKDGPEMQGMDYSSAEIIANLIAEVKSLRARVAALEAA